MNGQGSWGELFLSASGRTARLPSASTVKSPLSARTVTARFLWPTTTIQSSRIRSGAALRVRVRCMARATALIRSRCRSVGGRPWKPSGNWSLM